MKRVVVLLVIFCLAIGSIFSFSSGNLPFVESGVLIPLESDIYSKMDALFVLSGRGVPSTSRPYTVAEARNELNKVDVLSLSDEEKIIYEELYDTLFVEDKDQIALSFSLAPELYGHTNSKYNREEYWNYGYEKRSHLLSIALDNSTHGFYGHLELSMGKGMVGSDDITPNNVVTIEEWVNEQGKTWDGIGTLIEKSYGSKVNVVKEQSNYSSYFSFNLPNTHNSDINMPRRAYLNYASDFFSLGIYKSPKTWGYNKSGNFVFDSHNDYYNTLTLKTFSNRFSFEYTFMLPEAYRGGSNYYSNDKEQYRRVFAAHRVEFNLFNSLNISLSENVMYRYEGYIDLSLLNPALFYHNNVNNNQFNALAHAEIEYSFLPGFLLYGQLVIDQGSFPGFEDPTKEDQAMGYSIGLEHDRFILSGLARFSIEGIYTNPALYRPTGSSDFIINYNHLNVDDYYRYPFFTYIGYKYGGDTISVRIDANYRKDNYYLYTNFTLLFDGEFSLYDQYYSPMLKHAPSGDYDVIAIMNMGCEYKMEYFSLPIKALFDVSLVNSNKRGFDAQFTLGASVSYSLKNK